MVTHFAPELTIYFIPFFFFEVTDFDIHEKQMALNFKQLCYEILPFKEQK